jgi:hypothetical protein
MRHSSGERSKFVITFHVCTTVSTCTQHKHTRLVKERGALTGNHTTSIAGPRHQSQHVGNWDVANVQPPDCGSRIDVLGVSVGGVRT